MGPTFCCGNKWSCWTKQRKFRYYKYYVCVVQILSNHPRLSYQTFNILDVVPTGCCACNSAQGKTNCPDLLSQIMKNKKNPRYNSFYPKINTEDDFCNAPTDSKWFCGKVSRPVVTNTTMFVKDYCRVTCHNPPGNGYDFL